MSLAPRCASTATGSAVTALQVPLTAWTNSGAGPAGTAPVAGDIVLVVGGTNGASQTFTQSLGTGAWTVHSSDNNGGTGGALSSFAAFRVFDGSETAPTFAWTASGRAAFAVIAITPDAGSVVSIDVWATAKIDTTTTGATTHTPNSAAAAGTGEVSLVLPSAAAVNTGVVALTWAAPASWTLPSGGSVSQVGTSAQRVLGAAVMYRTGQSGTVTPGALTAEGGSATTGPTGANVYHVLIRETATSPPDMLTAMPGPAWRAKWQPWRSRQIVQGAYDQGTPVQAQGVEYASFADGGEAVTVTDAATPEDGSTDTTEAQAVAVVGADTASAAEGVIGAGASIQVSGYDLTAAARPGPAWRGRFQSSRPRAAISLPTDQTFASDSDAGSLTETQAAPALSDSDTTSAAEGGSRILPADADTGSAADSALVRISDTDSGSGAEGGPRILPADTDSGSGADSAQVRVSDTDSGSAADSALVRISDTDSAASTEASAIQAALSDADATAGTEGSVGAGVSIQVSGYDVGTAALPGPAWRARFRHTRPAGAISLPTDQTFVSDRDLGSVTEAQAAPALSDNETGSAAEGFPSIAPAGTDTGSGTDTGIPGPSSTDAAAATDAVSQIALSSLETAAGTEGLPAIAVSDFDAASAADSAQAGVSAADSFSAAEGVIGAGASIQVSGYDVAAVARPGLVWRRRFIHRTVQGALDSGVALAVTQVSDSDTGSAADASAAPAVTGADTATAAESTPSITVPGAETSAAADSAFIALSDAESAAGAEGVPAAQLTGTESAAAAEALSLALAGADTTTAADASAAPALSGADGASAIEAVPAIAFFQPDSLSAADDGRLTLAVSDSGTAADAYAVALSGQEAGGLAEAFPGIALSDTGTGSAADTAVLSPSSADSLSFAEVASVTVLITSTDTGSGDDEGTLTATRLSADTGVVADSQVILVTGTDFGGDGEGDLLSPICPPAVLSVALIKPVELVIALDVFEEDGSTAFLGLR